MLARVQQTSRSVRMLYGEGARIYLSYDLWTGFPLCRTTHKTRKTFFNSSSGYVIKVRRLNHLERVQKARENLLLIDRTL